MYKCIRAFTSIYVFFVKKGIYGLYIYFCFSNYFTGSDQFIIYKQGCVGYQNIQMLQIYPNCFNLCLT